MIPQDKATLHMIAKMESKLRELMGEKAYAEFAIKTAKESFMIDVTTMKDGDFKDFVLENFDEITEMGGDSLKTEE